jgi:hypothetical protein
MLKKEMLKGLTMAKVVYIVLHLVWALFLYGLIGDSIKFPRRLASAATPASLWWLTMFIFQYVVEIILLWILIHIHLIIRSVVRGEGFHPGNPKRLRRIAYGVFSLAAIFPLPQFFSGYSFKFNIKAIPGLLEMAFAIAFVGTVILLVAEVFARGVKLQEEQKLTI